MAQKGVEAVAAFAKDGTKPQATAGKNFVDTGVHADHRPAAGRRGVQGHRLGQAELLGLSPA